MSNLPKINLPIESNIINVFDCVVYVAISCYLWLLKIITLKNVFGIREWFCCLVTGVTFCIINSQQIQNSNQIISFAFRSCLWWYAFPILFVNNFIVPSPSGLRQCPSHTPIGVLGAVFFYFLKYVNVFILWDFQLVMPLCGIFTIEIICNS